MPLLEKFNIVWVSWKGFLVQVGGIFWVAASRWHGKKLWKMVELICVVAVHVCIEQCIDMLNVFKVNYKGHRVTFFEVSLVFFLNLIMSLWFALVWLAKESFLASFPDGAKFIGWNVAVLNYKLLYKNLLD